MRPQRRGGPRTEPGGVPAVGGWRTGLAGGD